MKKRAWMALILVVCLLLSGVSVWAAAGISVKIDGRFVFWTDASPFIDSNSRTLCPLRAVGEALGLTVTWDNANRVAIFAKDYQAGASDLVYMDDAKTAYVSRLELRFPIGSRQATGYVTFKNTLDNTVFGTVQVPVSMDTAAIIKNDRTYAPVRYLAQSYGYTVDWDNQNRTVIITKGK